MSERRRLIAGNWKMNKTVAEAEEFIQAELDWDGRRQLSAAAMDRFGELVAAAARPIDDIRGTAAYRRHALAVLARRCLAWALNEKWPA